MCFSGRGGEIRSSGGEWSTVGRDEVKRRFREGEADLLLCTDAAAEGLNFQFCGALINYDMPWKSVAERVRESDADGRRDVVEAIERQVREARASGFDIDATVDTDVTMPARAPSPIVMQDLDRVISSSDLMPPGTDIQPLGEREYGLLAPGMDERLRVTTEPGYYEEHSESVELWSPGNPLFTPPEFVEEAKQDTFPPGTTLRSVLDATGGGGDR